MRKGIARGKRWVLIGAWHARWQEDHGIDLLPGVLLGFEQGKEKGRCAVGPYGRERRGGGPAAREGREKEGGARWAGLLGRSALWAAVRRRGCWAAVWGLVSRGSSPFVFFSILFQNIFLKTF